MADDKIAEDKAPGDQEKMAAGKMGNKEKMGEKGNEKGNMKGKMARRGKKDKLGDKMKGGKLNEDTTKEKKT
jgi:hypothetical protein